MNRKELKDLAYSLASEYEEEMEGYYIKEDRLTEMAKEMNPKLDEIWIHRLVGFAKGILFQRGPDTEEELEGLRSQRGGSMNLEKIIKTALTNSTWVCRRCGTEYPIFGYGSERCPNCSYPIMGDEGITNEEAKTIGNERFDKSIKEKRLEKIRKYRTDSPSKILKDRYSTIERKREIMNIEKVVKVAIKEVLAEEYPINSVIIEEYEEIRQSGEINMIDMKRVRDIADSYGQEELVDYINEYGSKGYSYLLENYSKFKNKFENDDQKEDEKLEQVLKDFGPDEDW